MDYESSDWKTQEHHDQYDIVKIRYLIWIEQDGI